MRSEVKEQDGQTPWRWQRILTYSLLETGKLSAEDMCIALREFYTTLSVLKAQEEAGSSTPVPASPSTTVDWRKSIIRKTIICLECGKSFKHVNSAAILCFRDRA
jgi:predicted transcriptional regulator